MDLQLTKDSYIVVCHDETVDRTTNGTGRIDQLTLAQIQALDAGYHFAGVGANPHPFRGKGICIPTLEEVLDAFPGVPLNVELKNGTQGMVRRFVALLDKHGRLHDGSVLVSGFEHATLSRVRRAAPSLPTGFSVREIALAVARSRVPARKRPQSFKRAFQVPVKRSRITIVTPRFVAFAHKIGCEVHVWTVNDEREMHRLLDMGVDAIFSDYPAILRRVIDSRQI
jgi:glycerophosphoryl diester phosphodiesterase